MGDSKVLLDLVVSLGLGLLVGLQRERSKPRLGGIRTFGLITLLGTLSALLAQSLGGGWVVAAALIALAAAIVSGNLFSLRQEEGHPGITTEIAMLAMFGVGAYVAVGPREVAVAIGAVVAIILHAKPVLHGFVAKLGDNDVRAIMQFSLISMVILPAVPDRTYGPFSVLNPHNIWLMVVLVVAISLAGYVAIKVVGSGASLLLSGVLGGMVSSTATTVSAARRSAGGPHETMHGAAAVIMIASTVLYARLLIEISVTAPKFVPIAAGPIGVLGGLSAVLGILTWLGARREGANLPPPSNPTELRSALVFGGIYAGVLLAVAAAKQYLGHSGLYAVAGISGLTDMDAITLSVSRMVGGQAGEGGAEAAQDAASGALEASTAWRAIVIAAISNMIFKLGVVASAGGRALATRVGMLFGIQVVVALVLLVAWK